MSIYGISTEFNESIRFVTTVHSIDLFSDLNGSKWQKGIRNSSANSVNQAEAMTEIDARWGGRGAGWDGAGHGTTRQCMAGQGWVGWGRVGYMFSSGV